MKRTFSKKKKKKKKGKRKKEKEEKDKGTFKRFTLEYYGYLV